MNQGGFTIPIVPSPSPVTLFLPSGMTALPSRAPYMLPAINTATVTNTSTVPAPAANSVWKNISGSPLLIPGGGRIRSSRAWNNGFIASDGRICWPARQSGSTVSYYPVPFEQVLWNMFINSKMFPVGTTCTALFSLAIQLLAASSEAQYIVVIEQGVATPNPVGSPNTADTNVEAITWNVASPILRQQIILTPALITHTFGCTISNSSTGMTANALLYNQIVGANAAAPASANFALRARLIEFDTEESKTWARGWVQYSILAPKTGILGAIIQ